VQKQQAVHTAGGQRWDWEFYFSPIKYAISIPIRTIPISIPINIPKLLPFPMGIPWEWEWEFPYTPLIGSWSIFLPCSYDRPRRVENSIFLYAGKCVQTEHTIRLKN